MNPQEKVAWYKLSVIMMSLVAYVVLFLITDRHVVAHAGFALLALMAFSGFFSVGGKIGLAGDERDQLISLKAHSVALWVFWFYFTAFCSLALFFNNFSSTVPSILLISLLLWGICVMQGTHALVTLFLYRADSYESDTVADRFRKMSRFRRVSLVLVLIFVAISIPFFIVSSSVGVGDLPQLVGYGISVLTVVFYYLSRFYLGAYATTEKERDKWKSVRRRGDKSLLTGFIGVAFAMGLVWLMPVEVAIISWIPYGIFFVFICGLLNLTIASLMPGILTLGLKEKRTKR